MSRASVRTVALVGLCLFAGVWLWSLAGPGRVGTVPFARSHAPGESGADGARLSAPIADAANATAREVLEAGAPTSGGEGEVRTAESDDDAPAGMTLIGRIEVNGVPVLGGTAAHRSSPGGTVGPAVEISAAGTFELPLEAHAGRFLIHVETNAFSSLREEPLAIEVPLSLDVGSEDLEAAAGAGPVRLERTFVLDFVFVDVTVRAAGGGPIAGARVSCGSTRRLGRDHRADAKGRILHGVWFVWPTRTSVTAWAPGFASASVTVPIDPGDREQRVEVELWPVLPVAGTWTGLHGLLEVRDQCSWQIRRGGAWAGSCRMPMDDNFEFKGLGEGIYWIDVKGPKGVTTHRAELEVPAGGRTDLRLDFQPL